MGLNKESIHILVRLDSSTQQCWVVCGDKCPAELWGETHFADLRLFATVGLVTWPNIQRCFCCTQQLPGQYFTIWLMAFIKSLLSKQPTVTTIIWGISSNLCILCVREDIAYFALLSLLVLQMQNWLLDNSDTDYSWVHARNYSLGSLSTKTCNKRDSGGKGETSRKKEGAETQGDSLKLSQRDKSLALFRSFFLLLSTLS